MNNFTATGDNDGGCHIGQRIRCWRTVLRMTQRELGYRCGVTVGHISNWEHGKTHPSLRSIQALKRALGVSWGDLLGDPAGDNDQST